MTTTTFRRPTLDITIDLVTGTTAALGKNGRLYTMEEVDAALEAAERGDADALATVAALDHASPDGGPVDPAKWRKHILDNCPACRAERALRREANRALARERAAVTPPATDPNWWHGRRRRRGRR